MFWDFIKTKVSKLAVFDSSGVLKNTLRNSIHELQKIFYRKPKPETNRKSKLEIKKANKMPRNHYMKSKSQNNNKPVVPKHLLELKTQNFIWWC